ncbi:HAD hydrolase-like protein, partial [Klebsiella pneumoniae]|nr:HAD hydrolase-like protein [Klebsiella pneumoniae]
TIGKPNSLLFETACRRSGLTLDPCSVIGDNPDTDGKGAQAVGLPFLHVETGTLAERLTAAIAI